MLSDKLFSLKMVAKGALLYQVADHYNLPRPPLARLRAEGDVIWLLKQLDKLETPVEFMIDSDSLAAMAKRSTTRKGCKGKHVYTLDFQGHDLLAVHSTEVAPVIRRCKAAYDLPSVSIDVDARTLRDTLRLLSDGWITVRMSAFIISFDCQDWQARIFRKVA